jgi:hypothetical protein
VVLEFELRPWPLVGREGLYSWSHASAIIAQFRVSLWLLIY